MTTRYTSTVETLGKYFASKGKVMDMNEYRDSEDAPIHIIQVRRVMGSWSRLLNMIGDLDQYTTEVVSEVVSEVVPTNAAQEIEPVVEKTKGA